MLSLRDAELANAQVRGNADALLSGFRELTLILEGAERFAMHDPGVDWPSAKHTDPVDAICAALDELRERQAWEED